LTQLKQQVALKMLSKNSQKKNLDSLQVEDAAFLDKLQMRINGIKLACWILCNLGLMHFKISNVATSALGYIRFVFSVLMTYKSWVGTDSEVQFNPNESYVEGIYYLSANNDVLPTNQAWHQ
jgi:hypothetical protein